MARIRSIHPGIYTDEAWASVSIAARWFAKGLCTEADDNGTFEWKPLQLKMRIFPADTVDVPALLSELVAAGIVMQFQAEGRALGSLKNFCKYQRPRKPKSWFPTTPQSLAFAAVGAPEVAEPEPEHDAVPQKSVLTPVEPEPVPQKSEKSPQREDGGGRVEEEEISEANASSSPSSDKPDGSKGFEAVWKAYPHVRGRSSKTKAAATYRRIPAAIRQDLPEAIARYAKDGREPNGECGAPAMERWLRDSRYLDWLEEPQETVLPSTWNGPSDVREAFDAALGGDWCRAYLDPCAWQDVPERALIPARAYAARKIVADGRQILAKLGLTVLEKAA